TLFHYAIDSTGRVFITHRFVINTRLPAGFFAPSATVAADSSKAMLPDEEETPEQTKLKVSPENKLYEIGARGQHTQGKATLAGYVRDAKSGEPIIGASVYIDTPSIGVITDQFGYYALTLPRGRHLLKISSAGMKDTKRQVVVYSDGKLVIEMQEFVSSLKAVIVSAEKASNTKSLQMGVSRLTIKTIKQVPVVFGEADILKVVLTLPGVTSVGEAGNGFNVRGGSTDQNLILFSDATIYNPSHLFGFFTAFNPDVVKGIELYKSAIPEKYGGRLSSVLDVTARDGNSKQWTGNAGIGPLTSKFSIEGPIRKETTTFIAAVRTTYSDWLLSAVPNGAYKNSRANFYDANLHISHTINAKNSLYLTGYTSGDHFNLDNDTTYNYSNHNANIKWKHNFNNRHYALFTTGIDRYQYSVAGHQNPITSFDLAFKINQDYFRADFSYSANARHVISYGFNTVHYLLQPGSYTPSGAKSLVVPNILPNEQALESALYLGDQFAITPKFSVSAGLRYSVYNYLGQHDVYNYVPGLPREIGTIKDTAHYRAGQVISTYSAPEIRFSLRYAFSDSASVKLSFNTLQQYIHMLSNTVSVSPTDVWKLSDPNIKPQQGGQLSLGYYKNFRSNTIETSVEVYYKEMLNFLDYKSGAQLLLNPHIETDVINTRGKAYGIELLVKKTTGKINGWVSYTYSRTFLQQDDPIAGESINHGAWYPASFDKPHNANLIVNYRFSHRYSLSVNMLYSTGRPITLPVAVFTLGGSNSLLYSDRNQYRIPDYFRADVSFTMEGNHKVKQKAHNSWSFGIYNITGRQNAYSVYFVQENGKIKGYQLSIFGTLIPFVTYNIKF
ncbi:MAG TPA: TonB-dependent receptor, partial [Chitinophagaceae bacterium]